MKRICSPGSPVSISTDHHQGFTRPELLLVLAALTLLAGLVLPALAQSRPRSLQAICANNLRTLGQAVGLFNAENGADPWRSSWGKASGLAANCWYQYFALSNDLPDPRVLACPSDSRVRPARNYSFEPEGGFLSPSQQNNSVSYAIGLDSSAFRPDSVLSADRNLQYEGYSSGCSSGINPALVINLNGPKPSGWRNDLHGSTGNVLLHDGRIEATSNESVNRFFYLADDNGSVHFLSPRSP